MGNVHVGRGKINCVSLAHIILGAFMVLCGALQSMLQQRYLWLDSIYAGIWVGMWMIVTGIVGVIASFRRIFLIIVFMLFSVISTLLGFEIVTYYTYTFAAHWNVYWSSRNYLIIASVTYFIAIVEIIIGVGAVFLSYLFQRRVLRIAAENDEAQVQELSLIAEEAAAGQAVQETDAGQVQELSLIAEEAAAGQGMNAGQVQELSLISPEAAAAQVEPGNDARQAEIWSLDRPAWNELPRAAVHVKQQSSLGKGNFGVVNRGKVQIDGEWRPCAIKRVPHGRRDALRMELEIMVTVGDHPNIISLIGACTRDEPILIVLSLAENGSLKEYLERNRQNPISTQDKIKIARDVANGMSHLSSKRCIHRDLAARNVLLDRNNVAMVSDFGLSRDVYECGIYDQTSEGRVPTRWMAIESLKHRTYTTESDVWSFGVVMWEIESGGMFPYLDMGNREEVIKFLTNGKRLEQPHGCSAEIYEIMSTCWRENPSERPKFGALSTLLEQQLQNVTRASRASYNRPAPEN